MPEAVAHMRMHLTRPGADSKQPLGKGCPEEPGKFCRR